MEYLCVSYPINTEKYCISTESQNTTTFYSFDRADAQKCKDFLVWECSRLSPNEVTDDLPDEISIEREKDDFFALF